MEAVLPPVACQWRQVRWPESRWPEDPQRQLARHEAALQLGTPLSYLDVQLLPLALPQPTSLAVAVASQLLERWIEVFSLAGVSLVRLEAAQISLCRAFSALRPAGWAAPALALLQLESQSSWLLIVEQGVPVYERGLPGLDQGSALPQALRRTLQFWCQQQPDAEPPPLLCHGAAAADPERLRELGAGLESPLEVVDPLAEGWLRAAAEVPEGQQRPAGAALLPLWGLLAGSGRGEVRG